MLQFDSYIAKTMNPKTQTLKITNGKNIKESKNLKPKNYRKKKKVIQHRNIRKRCVTHKRTIYGNSHWNMPDSLTYCKK